MPAEWGAASIVYDLSGIGFQGFGGSSKDRTVAEGYAPCGSVSRNGRLRRVQSRLETVENALGRRLPIM